MTAIVISSIAILIGALNYLLLLALVRRLSLVQRELRTLQRAGGGSGTGRLEAPTLIVEPGERIDADRLKAQLAEYRTAQRVLIGFFSLDCSACRNQLAPFNRSDKSLQKVAIIAATADTGTAFVNELDGSTAIRLTGDTRGELHEMFQVSGFPAFALIDDQGLVLASGWEVADVVNVATG